ncbi:phage tail tip lysozyme [Bradyrhizobium sp. SZCCHNS3053]|uniref:phage tail tip lysozyme n=1 Tax=Bradyrhizobium sp. SZCCHNS3053 TaxID=3057322 RepID=UPI0029160BBE|nr:phage tail tip lysozyme [Bradyrhizobium sp. SZCCHNS3053]
MADENLDIKARLEGEDRLSPTIMKLEARLKTLRAEMARYGDKAKAAITSVPMENYIKGIDHAGKSLNGLTKKYYDWSKAQGVYGDKASLAWAELTNRIKQAKEEHERYISSTKRGSKSKAKKSADELRELYKRATAFQYMYNNYANEREKIARRIAEKETELNAAHIRIQQRQTREHLSQMTRMRREALQSMRSLSNIGTRAGVYAAAGAAATGYAGVNAFRTRMKVESAETNLRLFSGMSKDEVRKMRQSYGNAAAIKYGMGPDKLIDSYNEVAKANVPKDKVQQVTDSIVQAVAGLELDIKETTKFATRIASATQDMKNLDPDKLKSIVNSVTVAGIESAADPNEIIAANRRATGIFAVSKMKPEELSAFTGTGVGIGLQSFKTGTMMDFLVSELAGAQNVKGKRGEDLGTVARMLGFGSRQNMARQTTNNTADTLVGIFDKIGKLPEEKQNKVLTLLGMREWRGEIGAMVEARENLKSLLAAIRDPKNANRAQEIGEGRMKSLAGHWNSFVSAMTIVWESVGAGLEKAFGQITDFFTDYLGKLDTKKITDTVEAFTDGLVQGLGFDSWSEMLKAAFGDPTTVKSWAKEVGGFTKGFMSGMKEMWDGLKVIFGGLMAALGLDSKDPESVGKFTARLVEFGVALKAIGGFAETMVQLTTFINGLAAGFALLKGSAVLAALAKYGGAPASATAIGGMNTPAESDELNDGPARWKMLREKYGQDTIDAARKKYQPWYQFGKGYAGENEGWVKKYLEEQSKDPLFKKSSYTGPTEFSGRRRVSDLADSLEKFTGRVELAAFRGNAGGLQNALYGGGSGKGLASSVSSSGLGSGLGGVPALLSAIPGARLPSFGSQGGVIRRDSIPSFSGGGGSIGRPGSTAFRPSSSFSGKAPQIMRNLMNDFGLTKEQAAGIVGNLGHESGGFSLMQEKNPLGGGRGGWGWAQWTGPRRHQFEAWAAARGLDPRSDEANYGFMKHELSTNYASTIDAVKRTNSVGDATRVFEAGYERAGVKHMGSRYNYANQALAAINGSGSSTAAAAAAAGVEPGLADKLGLRGKANFMRGQYGGIGENQTWITTATGKRLQVNAAAAESFKGFVDELEASGYNIKSIGGYNKRGKQGSSGWSQHAYGNAIDINPSTNPQYGGTDMPANVRDMAAKYGLSWGGDWSKRYRDPMHFEWNGTQPWKQGLPQAIGSGVPPSSLIQNVPPPAAPPQMATGGMQASNSSGPVQIHINGSSHDPEALATLVQRRIDESVNWRTHDTASEYT